MADTVTHHLLVCGVTNGSTPDSDHQAKLRVPCVGLVSQQY